MFKKIAIKTGVLTTVFILAVIVSSYVTNRGNTDMSADMGGATLPRISFMTEGYEVNSLPGYKSDMTLTSMRDTLTPVTNNQLDMNIAKYDNQIQKVYWQVYTLNGKKCIQEGTIKDVQDTVTLNFKNTKILKEERILKVTLYLDNQNIYFYTRIKNSADCNYKKSLDFANDFHNAALENQGDKVESYLETDSSEDSSTYQEVTLASTQSQVTWGSLAPQVSGNVYWEIKECNENYTSLVLKYQVKCTGDTDYADRLYSVKEFFRIRTGEDAQQYLLDYDRTMNQRFDGKTTALNQKGVLVGIAPTDLEYETNTDGTIVAFIEDNQLWHYDKKEDEMSLVFGFADAENMDVRTLCDLHDIRLISVDEKGNTTFTVVGYMNRGVHEGQVGVDHAENQAERAVHQLVRRRDQAEPGQHLVDAGRVDRRADPAVRFEQAFPGIHADQEARPERQHDTHQQRRLPARLAACHEVGKGVADQQAEHRGDQCVLERDEVGMQVEVVGEQLQVGGEVKAEGQLAFGEGDQRADLRAVHLRQADAQDEHEGQQEEEGEPEERRADDRVARPGLADSWKAHRGVLSESGQPGRLAANSPTTYRPRSACRRGGAARAPR